MIECNLDGAATSERLAPERFFGRESATERGARRISISSLVDMPAAATSWEESS